MPSPNDAAPITLEQALQHAVEQFNAGHLGEAERFCLAVLEAVPEQPDAIHILSLIEQRGSAITTTASGTSHPETLPFQQALQQGFSHFQTGQFQLAVQAFQAALLKQPQSIEAMGGMGAALQSLGRWEEAEACYRKAITIRPRFASLHSDLGAAIKGQGRLKEALTSFNTALKYDARLLPALCNYGQTLTDLGRPQEALRYLRKALKLQPDFADALGNLGDALAALDRLDEAVDHYNRALATNPQFAEVHNNLGNTRRRQGRLDEAIACYQQALAIRPDFISALRNLGLALLETNNTLETACNCFEKCLTLHPSSALLQTADATTTPQHAENRSAIIELSKDLDHLGVALTRRGLFLEAKGRFMEALALRPDASETWANLARSQLQNERPEEALQHAEQAIFHSPKQATHHHLKADILADLGEMEQALEAAQKARQLDPDDQAIGSSMLFFYDITPNITTAQQQQLRSQWTTHLTSGLQAMTAHNNRPDPARRLKIGYVSADFCLHSAASTFAANLLNREAEGFEIFCYCNNGNSRNPRYDAVTDRFREASDQWREISHLNDDEVSEQVQQDGIDILVDLSGHSAGNRMGLFARRPAPIQATGWGYNLGSGLTTMDYLVIDPVMLPPEQHALFAERPLDLPGGIHLFPLSPFPDVGPLPVERNGFITFGAFHRTAKITPHVTALWAKVLQAVPNSRLLIKLPKKNPAPYLAIYQRTMADSGVSPDRILSQGSTDQTQHLAAFNEVDISLDPFPHGGGVTALESLRMGVPIIGLRVETIPGRLTSSFCATLGLENWVAQSPEAYIAIAKIKSSEREQLAQLRAELRQRFDTSILGNHGLYMSHLERLYRQMWQRWCNLQ
ncbi:MAG: tetratricopeptide repeat protein [Magnetococcales bacterium]|nr:tetratricopeptide repeat protein [Magnetococcales bacterium]